MSAADDLRSTLDTELPRLMSLSEKESAISVAPGKWTPKQIVGHLIDSASNNHGRFVRATLNDDFVFPSVTLGYLIDDYVGHMKHHLSQIP